MASSPASARGGGRQRGAIAVEFALVSVMFMMLLVGTFEVARLLYGLSAISNAAREGARYGIADSNPHTSPGTPSTACYAIAGTPNGLTNAALRSSQGIAPVTVEAHENGNPIVSCTVTVAWLYKPASGFFDIIKPQTYTSQATLYFYNITK